MISSTLLSCVYILVADVVCVCALVVTAGVDVCRVCVLGGTPLLPPPPPLSTLPLQILSAANLQMTYSHNHTITAHNSYPYLAAAGLVNASVVPFLLQVVTSLSISLYSSCRRFYLHLSQAGSHQYRGSLLILKQSRGGGSVAMLVC